MPKIKCSECSQPLTCLSSGDCWCNSYPKLMDLDDAKTCLCAKCLELALAKKILDNNKQLSSEQMKEVGALGEPEQLIQDLHYTMEIVKGKRLMMLSKWYLLRRGYCCDNGCRNCPY